jgi:hypothetical protein
MSDLTHRSCSATGCNRWTLPMAACRLADAGAEAAGCNRFVKSPCTAGDDLATINAVAVAPSTATATPIAARVFISILRTSASAGAILAGPTSQNGSFVSPSSATRAPAGHAVPLM